MAGTPVGGDEGGLARRVGEAATVQRVFDALPLILVGMEGPELRFTAVTAAARVRVGRSELIGLPIREAFPEVVGQRLFEVYDQVYASGQRELLREIRTQLKNDAGELLEIFADVAVFPWLEDGSVRGVIVHTNDVTARVRERQAAQAQAAEVQRRYEQARDVVDALQRELLPRGVPVLPGLEVAASYLLADADTAAGGDWFDALALDDGRVALVVGDVVGHGVAASATMGQLRVLLRERLSATGDLVTALDAVNAAAWWIPGAKAATVCVAMLDPTTGALSYCTAGHPAPLLLPVAGEAGFLPTTGAGPLGVGGVFTDELVGSATLDAGAMVLLYTDGILERPGRSLAQSSVELAQAAADVAADRVFHDGQLPAERVCTQTLEVLTRMTGHSDDITLLAGRRVESPKPLSLTLPADLDQLQALRAGLAEWLADCGASELDEGAVRHAVGELATNSMEHAYLDRADEGTTCEITATLRADGRLRVRVVDHGVWREPKPSSDRGLGLQVASGMVDALRVEHDEHGTVAMIEHALTRPARLLIAGELHAGRAVPRPAQADPLLILDQPWAPEPRIRVDGPVDAATAEQVEAAIREAGAAGTRGLTVDLTGVSHLASAGVAALHRVAAAHSANGTSLHLYAPTASPADAILTLVVLDHLTRDPHTNDTPTSAAPPDGRTGSDAE